MKTSVCFASFMLATVLAMSVFFSCSDNVSSPDWEDIPGYSEKEWIDLKEVRVTAYNTHEGIVFLALDRCQELTPDANYALKVHALKLDDNKKKFYEGNYLGQEIFLSGKVAKESTRVTNTINGVDVEYSIFPIIVTDFKGEPSKQPNWCGTPCSDEQYRSDMLFARSRAASTASSIVVSTYVHVLREPGKSGLDKNSIAPTIVQRLNTYYKGGISFTLAGSDYADIVSASMINYYNSQSVQNTIFSTNNKSNALNIYLFPDAHGDLLGIAKGIGSNACIIFDNNYNTVTLPHEVGHCLGLYHTHHGTFTREGGIPELVNGSNSAYAGDLIVDTPADPNVWYNGVYVGTGRDANGDAYKPDPKNIMSYSQVGELFTTNQYSWMIEKTISNSQTNMMLSRDITDHQHLKNGQTLAPKNSFDTDNITWKITKHYASSGVDDGDETTVTETVTAPSVKVSNNRSEYWEVTAQVRYSDNTTSTHYATLTTNAPSPYTATLAWSTNTGLSGGTTNGNWGAMLSVGSDNTMLSLEYLDKAQALLPGLTFRCVTAAHRMLQGSRMQINKADCSDGYLKIRVSDNCGTSSNYFTIPAGVSGGYYAISIGDDGVCFESRMGSAPSGGANKAPAKKPVIKTLTIYNSANSIVLNKELDGALSFTLPALAKGDYRAVLTDGNYSQEIPFTI